MDRNKILGGQFASPRVLNASVPSDARSITVRESGVTTTPAERPSSRRNERADELPELAPPEQI